MRTLLLKTAVNLIIERGYDRISISEICRIARTSKANFYTHFSSKRDIVREILADVNRRMFEALRTRPEAGVREGLDAYVEAYLCTIQSQGKGFTKVALKIMMDEDFEPSDVAADRHLGTIRRIIDEGIVRGELPRSFDCESFAWKLQTLFYGAMVDWCLRPDDAICSSAGPLIAEFLDRSLSQIE